MGNFLKYTSLILVIIGALNWGLVGIFNFDLVAFLFGEMSILTRIIYTIIGICAIISGFCVYNCHRDKYDDM
ncbi:MAG: DUF378 domain-containing protein [bacterium]|nr:DUF378 domain-containing protein [bacterium]